MVNIVKIKKSNKFKVLSLGFISLGILATSASAASSTAILNKGNSSAKGGAINIHDGSSRMTVTNSGGGPYQLIGKAKKSIVILPDPTVHTSYARPMTEVKSNFSPPPSTYYPVANTEYNTKTLSGGVNITD